MDKNEIKNILAVISVEFPQDLSSLTKEQLTNKISLWHDSLKDYDGKIVEIAVKQCLQTMHFAPKLADIIGSYKALVNVNEPTPEELWGLLRNAIWGIQGELYKFNHTFREANGKTQGEIAQEKAFNIYEQLPNAIKKYCGDYSGFINLAHLDDLQFEKARFLKRIGEIEEIVEKQEFVALKLGDFTKRLT